MTRRSQEPPGSAARPSPDGVETDRRGDETLLHDRRAADARDADWMLSRTRSSSACISVTGRSLAILVPTSFAWCRTPAIELDRRDPACDGNRSPLRTRSYSNRATCRVCRGVHLLEALAVRVPPTRSGDEASAQDRADSLASVDRRRAADEPSPRVDPFGRMPRHQPSWEGEVRLPKVSLLEPIGGHPSDLPGGMRFHRRSSYESQTSRDLDRSTGGRRRARCLCRPEDLSA